MTHPGAEAAYTSIAIVRITGKLYPFTHGGWSAPQRCLPHRTPHFSTTRPRDNRSHAASEGWGRGSDLAVTAPERPRRWPGSPCGCPAGASARRRSRRPIRGRLGRFRDQLHRISHRPSLKLAHVSGNPLIVRFLPGVFDHPAGGRTHSHLPAEQGFSLLRPTWPAMRSRLRPLPMVVAIRETVGPAVRRRMTNAPSENEPCNGVGQTARSFQPNVL